MKKPTKNDTINIRIWRSSGSQALQGIVGVIEYPLAIHRAVVEFEEIQEGKRSRYTGKWFVTHIPTGKGFGIRSKDWESVASYVEQIKDHPTLLMLTDDTMTAHPQYQDLCDLHDRLRRELF